MPESVTGTGGLLISGLPPDAGGSGQSIQDDRPIGFYARIIGQVSGNAYTAIEVDTGQPATFPAANVDPEGVAAYEVGGSTSVPTDGSAIVWLEPLSGAAGYSFKYVATGSSGITFFQNGTSPTYSLVSTGVWEDAGMTIPIPSAGSYLLTVVLGGSAKASAISTTAGNLLLARIYDVTNASPLTGCVFVVASVPVANVLVTGRATMVVYYQASGPATLRIEVQQSSGTTWTSAFVGPTATTDNSLRFYLKLS